MNCRNALLSAVSTALVLSASLSALAQTNPFLTLKSDASATLKVGDTFDIVTMVSPATTVAGSVISANAVQATLLYDPNVLSLSSVTPVTSVFSDTGSSNVAFNYNGGLYTGYRFYGMHSGAAITGQDVTFATFQFKVVSALTKPTTVGYSSYLLNFGPDSNEEATYGSSVPVDGSSIATLFNDGRFTGKWSSSPAAAPEASTYVMFAMGGLPLLVAIRRRRSKQSV